MKPLATVALVAILAAFCVGVQFGIHHARERPATLSVPPGGIPIEVATTAPDGSRVTMRFACTGYVRMGDREDALDMEVVRQ